MKVNYNRQILFLGRFVQNYLQRSETVREIDVCI